MSIQGGVAWRLVVVIQGHRQVGTWGVKHPRNFYMKDTAQSIQHTTAYDACAVNVSTLKLEDLSTAM